MFRADPFSLDGTFAKALLATSTDELAGNIATKGDAKHEFGLAVKQLNLDIRADYAKCIYDVGRSTFPLIIAQEMEPGLEGVGSTYTLYLKDGSMQRIVPVHPDYALYKGLSHMPLGIVSIISPFFNNPNSTAWEKPLEGFKNKLLGLLKSLSEKPLSDDPKYKSLGQMIQMSISFIDECLKTHKATAESYEVYAEKIMVLIHEKIQQATELQSSATIKALEKWKAELGPEEWSKLYVVIPTAWQVSYKSPRQQILEAVMDPQNINTHVIVAQGLRDAEECRTLLGRVVYDRGVARLTFGSKTEQGRHASVALSSEKDLMAVETEKRIAAFHASRGIDVKAIGNPLGSGNACPFARLHKKHGASAGQVAQTGSDPVAVAPKAVDPEVLASVEPAPAVSPKPLEGSTKKGSKHDNAVIAPPTLFSASAAANTEQLKMKVQLPRMVR